MPARHIACPKGHERGTMKGFLRQECKRAFLNWRFAAVVLFGCGLAVMDLLGTRWLGGAVDLQQYVWGEEPGYSTVLDVNAAVTSLYFWMPDHGTASRYYYLYKILVPIMAAIPYGASYLQDKKSGLINQLVVRCKGKGGYFAAKLTVTFVSGGMVAVIPLIASLIVGLCAMPWGVPVYSVGYFGVDGVRGVFGELFYTYPSVYVAVYLVYTFIFFGLLNCLCLFCVYFEENSYAVRLMPFIVYYGSNFIVKDVLGLRGGLVTCANMIVFYKSDVPVVLFQLAVIALLDLAFLFRIRRDVI